MTETTTGEPGSPERLVQELGVAIRDFDALIERRGAELADSRVAAIQAEAAAAKYTAQARLHQAEDLTVELRRRIAVLEKQLLKQAEDTCAAVDMCCQPSDRERRLKHEALAVKRSLANLGVS